MRLALVLAGALAGCGGGSLLDEPRASTAHPPVRSIESTGGQSPKIVGLYVEQMVKRVRDRCAPETGTTVELAMTVDSRGWVAEVGMRASAAALVPCARSELAAQRFPKAKGATLIAATIEF